MGRTHLAAPSSDGNPAVAVVAAATGIAHFVGKGNPSAAGAGAEAAVWVGTGRG